MHSFAFQIRGFSRAELQRQRDQVEKQSASSIRTAWERVPRIGRLFAAAIAVVASLSFLQWVYGVADRENAPATLVYGHLFAGRRVIVLQDRSGSMGIVENERLNRMLNELRRAGIKVDAPVRTEGGGFWSLGKDNSLKNLERALAIDPTADTIFVFSDFAMHDDIWDKHDEAGFQRLRELLEQRSRRLYLGTVNYQPPQELIDIADQSGGGLLQVK